MGSNQKITFLVYTFTLKHQIQIAFFRTLSESDAYFFLWVMLGLHNNFLMFKQQQDKRYYQDRLVVYRVYYNAKDLP